MHSSLGQKLTLLTPPLTVIPSFLNTHELSQMRSWFHENQKMFLFKDTKEGACQLRQCKMVSITFPTWKEKLQVVLNQMGSNFGLGNLKLNYEDLYCKQYTPGDHYGEHIDLAPSGLSFLYQFVLEEELHSFPAFILDGQKVNFQNNQLLVFHSSLPHSYSHDVALGTKAIVQVLPEISRCSI